MKKNIVIVSPWAERGGSLVLFLLSAILAQKGFNSKIYLIKGLPQSQSLFSEFIFFKKNFFFLLKILLKKFLIKIGFSLNFYEPIKCSIKWFPFVSKRTIVVYPELIYGNPLHAKKIVRWFLFHNRYPNDPNAYGKNELVFAYREFFNDFTYNPTCRLLNIRYFDSNLYKQTNFGERQGNCYIIRKGKNREDLPKVFDGPVIDDLSEKEKVDVLNHCKYCFDYDTQTFYATIACVCGCIPIVVMEPGKTKSDYMGSGDKDWGKAYGNTQEQIEYAQKTRQQRLDMLDFNKKNDMNVNYFIQEIKNFWS